jgi:hypothetical protein
MYKNVPAFVVACLYLSGCGTFISGEHWIRLESKNAIVKIDEPGYCGGPGSSVTYDLAPKAYVEVRSTEAYDEVSVTLRYGDTFRFTSKDISVVGIKTKDVGVSIGQLSKWPIEKDLFYDPTEKITMDRAYGGILNGKIQVGSRSGFKAIAQWDQLDGVEIQLPDAYFNDVLTSFAKIRLHPEKISYYQELCLR